MKEYQTSDMALIAALYTLGVEASSIDESNPKRNIYLFLDPDGVVSVYAQAFDMNQLMVPAQAYAIQLKLLRSRFYDRRTQSKYGQ
jgi:hypothetical protein